MALDLQKIRNDIYAASMLINKMLSLADAALVGKFSVEMVTIDLPQIKKDEIIARYGALKSALVAIISALP